jgi:hypothetical protein
MRAMGETEKCKCPECNEEATKQMSPYNFTFGWRLSDSSNEPGAKDKIERDI